jgi:hypothetical protein
MAVPACRPCISPMPFSTRLRGIFWWFSGTAEELAKRIRPRRIQLSFAPVKSALFRYGAEVTKWTGITPMILTGLSSPEYSFTDAMNVQKGVAFTHRNFVYDGPHRPLSQSVRALKSPVYLFEGRRDYVAPTACAAQLFDEIAAPRKVWVSFERRRSWRR